MLKSLGLVFLGVVLALLCVGGLGVMLMQSGTLTAILGNAPITTNSTLILERIQALSALTTTRYNYSMMISSQRDMPAPLAALYGDSLVFVAVGHVNAGIDLSQLSVQDIVAGDGFITVTLPPPTLQDCFLNEQESYVLRRDTGIFASASPDLDNSTRRYAVEQLRNAALQNQILEEAQTQARTLISELVESLSSSQAQIIVTPPDPTAPLPPTCQ